MSKGLSSAIKWRAFRPYAIRVHVTFRNISPQTGRGSSVIAQREPHTGPPRCSAVRNRDACRHFSRTNRTTAGCADRVSHAVNSSCGDRDPDAQTLHGKARRCLQGRAPGMLGSRDQRRGRSRSRGRGQSGVGGDCRGLTSPTGPAQHLMLAAGHHKPASTSPANCPGGEGLFPGQQRLTLDGSPVGRRAPFTQCRVYKEGGSAECEHNTRWVLKRALMRPRQPNGRRRGSLLAEEHPHPGSVRKNCAPGGDAGRARGENSWR